MMQNALKAVATALPLLFAIGFLAPLILQSIEALGVTAPLGASPLMFALIVAGGWGLFAQLTGRWI